MVPLAGTVAVLLANLAAHRLAPSGHLLIGVGTALALAAVARCSGLTPAEVGLGRWRSGLRWGGAAAALVAAAYGLGLVVDPVRTGLADADIGRALLPAVLLVIPLGTVVPEELAFRGVLWALLQRRYGAVGATAVSSALFGLWHVLPALGSDAGPGPTGIRVAGTVLVTGLAGLGFCWLRGRSGSLLAPALLHWALNGLGLLAVRAA